MPCSMSTVGPPPSAVNVGRSCHHLPGVDHGDAVERDRAVAQRQVEVASVWRPATSLAPVE